VNASYLNIVAHYEECLRRHGDSHRGVDWPRREDALKRYEVMLGILRAKECPTQPARLLDVGCGAGHLYEYLRERGVANVAYSGLDLSPKFVSLCRGKFPDVPFYQADLLQDAIELPAFDYVVMNGVFTEKRELSHEAMFDYFGAFLKRAFALAGVGMAFNVMSKHVEWEREDLFHLSMHALGEFLTREVSRHFVIRNDYGLYEYTAYVFKEAAGWPR
jgi:SAM-dependent methyltransferase